MLFSPVSLRRAMRGVFVVSCLSLLGFSASAYSQEQSQAEINKSASYESDIESVTVVGRLSGFGATKSDVPIIETARSISIETSEQFINKGAQNLSQTTSYMAGVSAETFGFSTRGDWIHSRGIDIPRYRDSIQELFGSYNTSRAEVYGIEQVELLKGPASVLYGEGSPGGIVNYVSKAPKLEDGGEVVVKYGSYDRAELAVDYTAPVAGTNNEWLYRVVGLYRNADTQIDYVNDDAMMFMPSITYMPSAQTSFTLTGLYQDNEGDTGAQFIPVEGTLEPLSNGGYIDQDVYVGEPSFNKYDTKTSQLTFLAEHQINDTFSVAATALWRDGEADYHQAWAAFTGDGASRYLNVLVGMDIATDTTVPRTFYQADNRSEQYATDVRLKGSFIQGNIGHELLLGIQYQDVTTDNNSSYYYGGGALEGDFTYVLDLANPAYTGAPDQSVFDAIYNDAPEQKVKDLGLYLSDQVSIDSWRINAGLRYDEVDNDDGIAKQSDYSVSASAGLLYQFDSGVSPYVSYAESFETVVGTSLAGNQFEPEEARQYEAGLKYEPEAFDGVLTLSYFDIEISNLTNPNSLPEDAVQQQGVSTLSGVELEAKANLGEFYLQGALSTLDAKDPDGYELAGEPDSNASFWTMWRPTGDLTGFRAGMGVRYVGKSVAETATLRYETPSYTLGDLMLAYELSNGIDFALNVRNVSDKEYLTSCLTRGDCFPGVRRTVNATVTFPL